MPPDSPKQKTPPKMIAVTVTFPDPVEALAARDIEGREADRLSHWPYNADVAVVELARAVLALRLEVAALKRGSDA